MGKIIEKRYYKIDFQLESPLSVGSGLNRETDRDILCDARGIPYIPGSAVAGTAASVMKKWVDVRQVFGYVPDSKEAKSGAKAGESTLVFYDANVAEEDAGRIRIVTRDQVALDEWKTAKKGAKFDMQVLEPGLKFTAYMEQNVPEGKSPVPDEIIAKTWLDAGMTFGAKTTRGYGQIGYVKVSTKAFALDRSEETLKWLDFDLYASEDWNCISENIEKDESHKLILGLRLKGGISIRSYTTMVTEGDAADPDFQQLTVDICDKKGNKTPKPVIPGTTWAGAFAHHMEKLVPGCTGDYFVRDNRKKKSRLRFSESQIDGAKYKVLSRNAIDRFTGGTVDAALFTEAAYFGGGCLLEISFDGQIPEKVKTALAAAAEDLHHGFLSVGGETSIGRGVFEVRTVNGNQVSEDRKVYDLAMDVLNGGGKAWDRN